MNINWKKYLCTCSLKDQRFCENLNFSDTPTLYYNCPCRNSRAHKGEDESGGEGGVRKNLRGEEGEC